MLKTYGAAPYGAFIKKLEKQIKEKQQSVDEKIGVKVRPLRLCDICVFSTDLPPGVRHWSRTAASMGRRSGPATNGRGATTPSGTMYEDHSG